MTLQRVLLFEASSRWTAELEQHWQDRDGILIRWRPHFPDLLAESRSEPPDLIVCCFPAAEDASLDQLQQLAEAAPAARLFVLAGDPPPDWEWIAREIGADAVFPDTLEPRRFRESIDLLISSRP